MKTIGFATGALARGDFDEALRILDGRNIEAVELSALREAELPVLAAAVPRLKLSQYRYVSVHAPSRWEGLSETQVVRLLKVFAEMRWPIVLHPDCIVDYSIWRPFESLLLIENMDKRKPIGRSAEELRLVFDQLPEAGLCFDIGHARQVDPTMSEAFEILRAHGSRLRQVHMSHVDSSSAHVSLGWASILAFQKVAHLIPDDVPIILESLIKEDAMTAEIEMALEALTTPQRDLAETR